MSDNVIILGAGASADAGIPMLGNFIDTMIHMSLTGRGPRGPLTDEEKKILQQALDIRNTIENYHARVSIDQFDLEQILSVLVFESQTGSSKGRKDLEIFTRAIATTIELTCSVMHDGKLTEIQESGAGVYRAFWIRLLGLFSHRMSEMPTILSFNYDLVLERALIQAIVGYQYAELWRKSKLEGFEIDLQGDTCVSPAFCLKRARWGNDYRNEKNGYVLENDKTINRENSRHFAKIKLYKLHGSLNFPDKKSQED